MTDRPQWAEDKAHELCKGFDIVSKATLEDDIARALAEAKEEGRREQFDLVTRQVFEDALEHGVGGYRTTVGDNGQVKMARIDPSELKPAAPEVG